MGRIGVGLVLLILSVGCGDGVASEPPTMVGCQPEPGATTCPDRCTPVITTSRSTPRPCTKDGIFLGCVPAADSGFWGEVHADVIAVCDRPVFDPAYYYCLEGRGNVAFYFSGIVAWCTGTPDCNEVEVVTMCDWDSNAND